MYRWKTAERKRKCSWTSSDFPGGVSAKSVGRWSGSPTGRATCARRSTVSVATSGPTASRSRSFPDSDGVQDVLHQRPWDAVELCGCVSVAVPASRRGATGCAWVVLVVGALLRRLCVLPCRGVRGPAVVAAERVGDEARDAVPQSGPLPVGHPILAVVQVGVGEVGDALLPLQ